MRVSLSLRFSLVLCGLLVSAPFLNPHHSYPLLTFYTEWLAFAIGLAALAAIATAPSGAAVPIPGLCVGLFLLTALLVLQAALGQVAYPLRSATGALYAIWASLLAMLGVWLRSELGEAAVSRALQWWIAAAGFLAAASGFVQYYHVPLPGVGVYIAAQPTNWMFGTVGQPNNFADYLGCAVISVAFLHARNALSLLPALLIALPLAAGMALSGSRGPWGYVVIPFAFLAINLRIGVSGQVFRQRFPTRPCRRPMFLRGRRHRQSIPALGDRRNDRGNTRRDADHAALCGRQRRGQPPVPILDILGAHRQGKSQHRQRSPDSTAI